MKPPLVPYALSALRLTLYSERIAFTGHVLIEHNPPIEEAALITSDLEPLVEGGVSVTAIKSIEEQEFVIGMRSR